MSAAPRITVVPGGSGSGCDLGVGVLRVGLLGPVELTAADQPVRLGPPLRRAVLALLVLRSGRVVPAEQLVDDLWGGDPPASARKNLQGHVCALRKHVGSMLVTRTPGYELLVADDAVVDLDVFERRLATARTARVEGDLAAAADHYRDALALWRGPALADVATIGVLGTEADALEERRLLALKERLEVDLELGRGARLGPELSALVDAHPLDERLRELHVRVLADEGRRADAWSSYRTGQALLEQELGVAVGAPLQELAEAMRGNGSVRATGGALVGAPGGAPVRQLPPSVAAFVGRGPELATVRGWLNEAGPPHAPRLVVVTGAAGIGKSALAVHAGHEASEHFPDGQLYVDLHGATVGVSPLSPLDAARRLLRALEVPADLLPTDVDEAADRLRSLLAGRRMLLVLDDAATAAQVRPLLPPDDGSSVIITSRSALPALVGAQRLELGPLADEAAVALLARIAGPARLDVASPALADVLRWLGGLPLALTIAGGRLAARPRWTIGTLRRRLVAEHRRLDELSLAGTAVRTSLRTSVDSIHGASAARLFRLLGLLDGPHAWTGVAAALLDVPLVDAQAALDELVDAHLVAEAGRDRYRMHDLVRLFARGLVVEQEPAVLRAAAVRRSVGCYLDAAVRAVGDVGGGAGRAAQGAARSWLEAERLNLLAAVRHAAADLDPQAAGTAVQLALTLSTYFRSHGHLADWISVDRLARAAARRAGDLASEAHVLTDLGIAYQRAHQLDAAIESLRASLALCRRLGDRAGEARTRNALGVVHSQRAEWPQAAEEYAISLRLRRELGDRSGEAATQSNRGTMYTLSGRHAPAVRCYRAALRVATAAGDRETEANALCNLGDIYCRTGRFDSAIGCLEQALAVHSAREDASGSGVAHANLAEAHRAVGALEVARRHAERSVAQYRTADSRWNEGIALRRLATIERELGHPSPAQQHLHEALAIFTGIDAQEAAQTRQLLEPLAQTGEPVGPGRSRESTA